MDQTPIDVSSPEHEQSLNDRPMSLSPRRHSPALPLVPLEFLQSQRRGSLTDPSLHVSPSPSGNGNSASTSFRQPDLLSSQKILKHPDHHLRKIPPPLTTRPDTPFRFGEASSQSHAASKPAITALLDDGRRGKYEETNRLRNGQLINQSGDEMDMDSSKHRFNDIGHDEQRHSSSSSFDYNMRRHSVPGGTQIGLGHPRGNPESPSQVGTKRKMSTDRGPLPSVGEEIDSRLTGPGVRSGPIADPEEPAPKRRSSAFDTQRMAQMSLQDRRDSIDSRMSGTPSSTWWPNERRDSSSSMFSGTSLGSSAGFNSPAFSGEMHGRQPSSMSAFAWPSNPSSGPNDPTLPQGLPAAQADPNLNRHLDTPIPPHSVPSSTMPADRRMSAPDTLPLGSAPLRGDRSLRSRSRPPSRSAAVTSRMSDTGLPSPDNSPTSGKPDESPISSSSAPPSSAKEIGSTPYSRSPELRVSHKLAERKRRKEMRDLFDELRDQLPADRGMKASKWEILSKAIDYIQQLKQREIDMSREVDLLRHELESVRHGVPPYGHHPASHPAVLYAPPSAHYPPPPPAHNPLQTQPSHPLPSQQSLSRPGSSHNTYASGPGGPVANGKAQS